MSRLRQAPGTISPVIYFENSAGNLVLAAFDEGKPELARQQYLQIFKPKGYEWREASRWEDVQRLQDRLIDQERRSVQRDADRHLQWHDEAKRKVYENLRARMTHSDCSPFERDCIDLWLRAREEKGRKLIEQRLLEHQSYLWIAEMDSGTHITDRMKGDNSIPVGGEKAW